jgi:hypothetical protein
MRNETIKAIDILSEKFQSMGGIAADHVLIWQFIDIVRAYDAGLCSEYGMAVNVMATLTQAYSFYRQAVVSDLWLMAESTIK